MKNAVWPPSWKCPIMHCISYHSLGRAGDFIVICANSNQISRVYRQITFETARIPPIFLFVNYKVMIELLFYKFSMNLKFKYDKNITHFIFSHHAPKQAYSQVNVIENIVFQVFTIFREMVNKRITSKVFLKKKMEVS